MQGGAASDVPSAAGESAASASLEPAAVAVEAALPSSPPPVETAGDPAAAEETAPESHDGSGAAAEVAAAPEHVARAVPQPAAVQGEAVGAGAPSASTVAEAQPEDGRSCGDASSDQYSMQEYDSASQSDASAAEPRSPSHGADAECTYLDPLPTVREDEALQVGFNHGGALGRGGTDGTDLHGGGGGACDSLAGAAVPKPTLPDPAHSLSIPARRLARPFTAATLHGWRRRSDAPNRPTRCGRRPGRWADCEVLPRPSARGCARPRRRCCPPPSRWLTRRRTRFPSRSRRWSSPTCDSRRCHLIQTCCRGPRLCRATGEPGSHTAVREEWCRTAAAARASRRAVHVGRRVHHARKATALRPVSTGALSADPTPLAVADASAHGKLDPQLADGERSGASLRALERAAMPAAATAAGELGALPYHESLAGCACSKAAAVLATGGSGGSAATGTGAGIGRVPSRGVDSCGVGTSASTALVAAKSLTPERLARLEKRQRAFSRRGGTNPSASGDTSLFPRGRTCAPSGAADVRTDAAALIAARTSLGISAGGDFRKGFGNLQHLLGGSHSADPSGGLRLPPWSSQYRRRMRSGESAMASAKQRDGDTTARPRATSHQRGTKWRRSTHIALPPSPRWRRATPKAPLGVLQALCPQPRDADDAQRGRRVPRCQNGGRSRGAAFERRRRGRWQWRGAGGRGGADGEQRRCDGRCPRHPQGRDRAACERPRRRGRPEEG